VRTYLQRHAYACAESRQLWEAYESAAAIPITAMVQNWIGQPGYPLITARRQANSLQLSQHRFTYLPYESEQTWKIPINLACWTRSGQCHEQALIFEDAGMAVDLPPDLAAYKLNYGQTGFYRVVYEDDENLSEIGKKVLDGSLSYTDRWGLQNDFFALVRAGRLALDDWLAYLRFYEKENAYLPLVSIAGHLQYAYNVVQGSAGQKTAEIGAELCRKVLTAIGMEPVAGEAHTLAALRNQILWQAAGWDVTEAVDFGVAQFQAMMADKHVHPDIARSVMQIGAHEKGPVALNWFKRRFAQSASEHERMNVLAGMTAFAEWALVEEAMSFVLEAVPPRNQFMPIAAAAGNPEAAPRMWAWYRQHLGQLEAFHPLLYERVITGIVPVGGLGHEQEAQAFFESYVQQRPNLKDAVELALENLEINSRLRLANSR
jgi:aminopeptidase N